MREADGRPDKEFGDGGSVAIVPPAGTRFHLGSVAVDSRGRILVGGTAESLSGSAGIGPEGFALPTPATATVYRFLAGGRLDASFGAGGVFSSALGQQPPQIVPPVSIVMLNNTQPPAEPSTSVTALTVDDQDRPILVGVSPNRVLPCSYLTGTAAFLDRTFTARLTVGGTLDGTFGAGGVVTDETIESPRPPALRPNGTLALLTPIERACRRSPEREPSRVTVLPGNGAQGWSFETVLANASGGETQPVAVATDPRGRIVVLQAQKSVAEDVIVGRYLASGTPDRTFGKDGIAFFKMPADTEPSDLRVDAAGRPLVAMRSGEAAGNKFVLRRLTTAGKLDRSFGIAGTVESGFGAAATLAAPRISLGKGGIVLSATATGGPFRTTGYGLVLSRTSAAARATGEDFFGDGNQGFRPSHHLLQLG